MYRRPSVAWYAHNLFCAVDQLINALLGGWCDETLSSYAYRLHQAGKPWGRLLMPPIDAIFSIWQGRNHCERAYIAERERLHAPPESR